ncbi:hypothetical protein Tco_0554636, partial [Tanacetum coccineum]
VHSINESQEDKEDNESEEDEEDIVCSNGDVEHCLIRQRDKRSNIVVDATNPLPDHLRDKRHRYGPCIEESKILASEIYSTVEDCINLIRNDPDKLRVFLSKVKDLKKDLEIDAPSQNAPQNKDALYEDLLGVKAPVRVSIKNPKDVLIRVIADLKVRLKKVIINEHVRKKIDDALYEANKRASKDKNIDAEEEEVNEYEEDEEDSES